MEGAYLFGVLLALSAAFCSAIGSLLIRLGSDEGDMNHAVFITLSVNCIILLPIVVIIYYPAYGLNNVSIASFAAAGIASSLLARLFRFKSIERIGASRTEPIFATWALVATILGILFLGETLTVMHGLGILLVITGVTFLTWVTSKDNSENLTRRELVTSLVFPFAAAFSVGWEPIFANFGLDSGTPAPVGLVIKTVAALLGLLVYLRMRGTLPLRKIRDSSSTRWFGLAGVAFTGSLLCYYYGLQVAPVNIIAPIFATNTLFVVLLSLFFMPSRLERVTWPIVVAVSIVVSGVIIVSISG